MTAKEIHRDHQRLLNNLKLLQTTFRVKPLCDALGFKSEATWFNRMKEPWRLFSYDDFKILSRFCKVDFVQLVDGELKVR